jgi:uncharacterized surface protein with fasciclin (FAS1) repeats
MIFRKNDIGFKILLLIMVVSGFLSSCRDKFEHLEKYQHPEWLEGKLYTQIASDPDLSSFAQCLVDVGYDSIIDKSGTYTAFAPTNEAFDAYLSENSYSSIEDIPFEDKSKLVKFNLLQMPWSMEQLQGLSAEGWINEDDLSNDKPYAFKRETLLKNDNKSYHVDVAKYGGRFYETIVPEAQSNETRIVYANSRKYAPMFFDSYLSAAKLKGDDYSFYFDRSYEPGSFYFAGGKVVGDEIYAENGFAYKVDKVITPLLSAEELMEAGNGSDSYSNFLNLIHSNSYFNKNVVATREQEGADLGLEVDELFNLSYPGLGFDIHQEVIHSPLLTIEYHNGIVVPTNNAFNEFVDNVLTGPGRRDNFSEVPEFVKHIIVRSHMSELPIYLNDITDGFFNSEGDYITIDQSKIVQKSFGSNSTFIGVNEMITPKAFSSVSGPMYLDPGFLTYLAALDFSRLLRALKDERSYFLLFAISDSMLMIDESLELEWRGYRNESYYLRSYDYSEEKRVIRPRNEISDLMYSQIGIEPIVGLARIEFIETMDGHHIVINNMDNTITGGEASTFGYMGDSTIVVNHKRLEGDFYNGDVYEINGWLEFPLLKTHRILFNTKFMELLIRAGLAGEYEFKFTNPTERYTIFLPSDQALIDAQVDTLSIPDLKDFLQYHILKNELIFTDGKKQGGLYKTMSKKKYDSGYVYQFMNIEPGIDEISILKLNGDLYYKITEEVGVTNIIGNKVKNYSFDGNESYTTGAVIHEIDTVLVAN